MPTTYTATQVVNERPRPRVLVYVSNNSPNFDWAKSRSATFRRVTNLGAVDLTEWDVLVTDQSIASTASSSVWGYQGQFDAPRNLNTFRVMTIGPTATATITLDVLAEQDIAQSVEATSMHAVRATVRWRWGVPGHRSRRVNELPEPLQDLVQESLVPAIEARDFQSGIELPDRAELVPTITDFRPFLVGPDDLPYAASYRRIGGSRHWVVPSDAGDLDRWFDSALAEWHLEDPQRFPVGGVWQTSEDWMTPAERETNDLVRQSRAELAAATARLKGEIDDGLVQLDSLRAAGDSGLRRLLTSKDEDLQDAVLAGLVSLGFEVRDMDLEWEERDRREDYRLADPDDSGWLALADATGSAKGARLAKLSSLQAHMTRYLIEERPEAPPALWLIINHLFHRDPKTRGPLFAEGNLSVFEDAYALAIDSAALFVLVRESAEGNIDGLQIRRWLRAQRGQVTLEDTLSWLEDGAERQDPEA